MTYAIYPGSFDPLTNGHLDIIQRAAKLFDYLTIAVIDNPNKSHLLSLTQRTDLISQIVELDNVAVDSFSGLLVDYCAAKKIHTVVRGLRSSDDLNFEQQLAHMNAKMDKEFETAFLLSRPENACISSSLVREIHRLGGDVSGMVPYSVIPALPPVIPA